MATGVVTYEAYEELALREPDQFWELHALPDVAADIDLLFAP